MGPRARRAAFGLVERGAPPALSGRRMGSLGPAEPRRRMGLSWGVDGGGAGARWFFRWEVGLLIALLLRLRELRADGTVPRETVLRMESLRDARLEGVRDVGLASALPARVGDRLAGGSSPPGLGRFQVRMLPTDGRAPRGAAEPPEQRPRLSLKEEWPMLSVELRRLVESRSDVTRVMPCFVPFLGDARLTESRWRSGVYSASAECSAGGLGLGAASLSAGRGGWGRRRVTPDMDTTDVSESLRARARSMPPRNCTDRQESEATDTDPRGLTCSSGWSCVRGTSTCAGFVGGTAADRGVGAL